MDVLRTTRSIVGGSVALLMVSHLDFQPGDIDIYTPMSQSETVLALVDKRLGFSRRASASLSYDDLSFLKLVYYFEKGDKKMNVMIVRGEDPSIAIFQYHSTVVMNFLTAFGLYCGYPSLTLANLGVANLPALLRNPDARGRYLYCFQKYRGRGFLIEGDVTDLPLYGDHVCRVDAECPHTIRSTLDGKGLYVDLFSPPSVAETELRALNGSMVVWHLGGPMCGQSAAYFEGFVISLPSTVSTVRPTSRFVLVLIFFA